MLQVMIVDDEPLMRKGLASLVDWASINCEISSVCENGSQAIDKYNQSAPDIIISDIKMPLVDGIGLAKHVFENGKKSKIILLTAFADFSYAQKAIAYGVCEYVTKTGNLDELTQAVQKCVSQIEKESKLSNIDGNATASFFCKIVTGVLLGIDEIESKISELGVANLEYRLCLFDLTQRDVVTDEQFVQLRAQATRLLEKEFIDKQAHFLPLSKELIGVVLPISSTQAPKNECSEIANVFTAITQKLISIGISEVHKGVHSLSTAYNEAREALARSFFDNKNIHSFDTGHIAKAGNVLGLLDEINEALKKADITAATALLERLFAMQRQVYKEAREVKEHAMLLLNTCCSALSRVGADADDLSFSRKEWRLRIDCALLFDDVCEIVRELVNDTCRTILWFYQMTGDIAAQAKKYVEEHYCENITLRDIAAHVNVHPGYLSRYFKQKTGSSITDTITQLRMEKAKRLLQDGAMLVYEVGQAIGIIDVTYFSHVFRKYTGLSPKQWQKQLAIEKSNN